MWGPTGMTLRQVLRNAALSRHFFYLQNNAVFAKLAGVRNMLAGTAQNEAEHMHVKRWCHCIWQQHADRPAMISEIFGLDRMLANYLRNQVWGYSWFPAFLLI